jgi:hypothetical protein
VLKLSKTITVMTGWGVSVIFSKHTTERPFGRHQGLAEACPWSLGEFGVVSEVK